MAGDGYQLRFELLTGAAWAGDAGAVLWAESAPLSVAAGSPFRVVVVNGIGRCIAGQACLDQVQNDSARLAEELSVLPTSVLRRGEGEGRRAPAKLLDRAKGWWLARVHKVSTEQGGAGKPREDVMPIVMVEERTPHASVLQGGLRYRWEGADRATGRLDWESSFSIFTRFQKQKNWKPLSVCQSKPQ